MWNHYLDGQLQQGEEDMLKRTAVLKKKDNEDLKSFIPSPKKLCRWSLEKLQIQLKIGNFERRHFFSGIIDIYSSTSIFTGKTEETEN